MRFWLLGLFLFLAAAPDTNAAETWAQRLGYKADDRVVIMYVDHMGAAYETNIAGMNALSAGQATSASVKVPCPWFEQFALWSRANHDQDVGLSLTLNSPGKAYRWRPLTGDFQSSTLIDPHGYFWTTPHQAAVRVDRDQVEAELVMQIERARTSGIHPSHIIPAMGTMFMRADLLDLYLNLAEKYWIPAVVVELTPDHIERFAGRGFAITDDMQMLLDRYPLPKLDDIKFLEDANSYPQKQAELAKAIRGIKPGLTQIMFAPAIESASLKAMTPRWQQLVWDAKLLADPATKALLKKEGVHLTNWREVMQRFEKGVNPNSTRGR
ncbi:MAG: ChbG/HpnK family deacetylase [Planctomycetaceae bacterium]|nr:ChbG/HpnK family deacetylase [Planctomycetaceae bacterium]